MKLVVGLGNPGERYRGTRHNVGFEVVRRLADRFGRGAARTAFQGEAVDADFDGERVLLLCPHTFMNRSGASVVRARDFYKLENRDILIVCDDFNLDLGVLRVRGKGSSGGQKGLADIVRCLGDEEVPRLRIGIGQPPGSRDPVDFVLTRFSKNEQPEIELALARAGDAAAVWVAKGIDACMNQFNPKSKSKD